jgi:hypothetical protein
MPRSSVADNIPPVLVPKTVHHFIRKKLNHKSYRSRRNAQFRMHVLLNQISLFSTAKTTDFLCNYHLHTASSWAWSTVPSCNRNINQISGATSSHCLIYYHALRSKLNLCGMHPVALPMIRYRHIIYTMYINTYNPQSQPTILTLFLLILSLHVTTGYMCIYTLCIWYVYIKFLYIYIVYMICLYQIFEKYFKGK